MKTVKIGILGAGTVGRGLISAIRNRGEILKERTGLDIQVVAVFDRSYLKKKEFLGPVPASDNPDLVLKNPDVDLVVELMGGLDPAGTMILQAIESGKSVVTANKALLAARGREIFSLAEKKQVNVGFEAAVAGALPVIKSLRRSLVVNEIRAFYGILNGTCNFIISRMKADGMDYSEALKLAQERGFAEADPSFDVGGNDAAQKLALLAGLAFDSFIPESEVQVEGITSIRKVDLDITASMHRVIRLLALASRSDDGKVRLRVHPVIIPEGHVLAHVEDEKNAVFFETSHSGPTLIMGQGAGADPTAAAVVSDIVSIGKNGSDPERWYAGQTSLQFETEYRYSFYLRFQTANRPGVLAEIARVLSQKGISIARFQQEDDHEPVQVVIITHESDEAALLSALAELDSSEFIKEKTTMIRILDEL